MLAGQPKPPITETRRRLLEAAARVFAQKGLEGATTREIAREAGVNEVTLFRHFQSKENLLTAVLQSTFDRQEASLLASEAGPGRKDVAQPPADLRVGLGQLARKYEELLRGNILLLRTLIGEIHRHSEHEAQVMKGIFAPLKADMAALIRHAQEQGIVRAEIDPTTAAVLIAGMIFMDVLRRSLPSVSGQPPETSIDLALDVFLHGIQRPEVTATPPGR